jgi:DNA-binding NarL/FixJ family response regulator
LQKQTVLIADDHSILRAGLCALLSSCPDLEVVGEAKNGLEAIEKARQLRPQIILLDLSMPLVNGTEVIRTIKQRSPETRIIALTVHKTEEYIRAALDAGADGYVLKDDTSSDLLTSINNVHRGKTHLSPGICEQVINGFLDNSTIHPSQRSWDRLTLREREILKLVAEGNRNREIAGRLSVSIKTVEKHRSNVMKKLNLRGVSALTAYAIEHRLIAY